jgi:hypothetical protein
MTEDRMPLRIDGASGCAAPTGLPSLAGDSGRRFATSDLDPVYLRDDHDLLLWNSMRSVRVASLPVHFSNRGLVADWDERFGEQGWDLG